MRLSVCVLCIFLSFFQSLQNRNEIVVQAMHRKHDRQESVLSTSKTFQLQFLINKIPIEFWYRGMLAKLPTERSNAYANG